jgi:lipid-A-disaccharide synthase
MELLYHLKDFSSWGISEVIAKIPFYKKALKRIVDEVVARDCKTAILIDFQEFNLRLAQLLKKKGVRVLYYVAPQAWVWKAHRTKILQKNVHSLYTILPFEKEWFHKRGVRALSVSHPLIKGLEKSLVKKNKKDFEKSKINIVLLPGSRNSEVKFLLPEFYQALDLLKNDYLLEISLVKSPNVNPALYFKTEKYVDKIYSSDELEEALLKADFALAASGTVTLACGLLGVPTIVSYKLSLLNEFLFETFLSYKGPYSLPNIILKKNVFPELLQNQASGYNMAMEIKKLLRDKSYFQQKQKDLAELESHLSVKDVDPAEHMLGVIQNG